MEIPAPTLRSRIKSTLKGFGPLQPLIPHYKRLRKAIQELRSQVSVRRKSDYPERIREIMDRRASRKWIKSNTKFSITTTVWNTDPIFLNELFRTISAQIHGNFEWLILDNGSTNSATRECLSFLTSKEPRIQLFRVEKNIHIIGGNRYLVERATGDYIVPVDSDDVLYSDSLAILASTIESSKRPALLYSDEQKVATDTSPVD